MLLFLKMTEYTTFLSIYCPLSRGTNSIFVTMRTQFPELLAGMTEKSSSASPTTRISLS